MLQTAADSVVSKSKKGLRRPFWSAILVIFIWFGASGVFGPLFGKLTTVQENDNSAFLPSSAESTKAAKGNCYPR